MRSLAPAESLIYLETNDVADALQPIVDSKPFNEVAKYKPDLSALKGVQLAVAVTGFETSEEKVDDDSSIGRVRPHFVAIADTHAWNFQAVKFAEQKLGGFIARIYDSEPTLERSDKNGDKYFIWTAQDGRKAYALVVDSLIYFGNDESSIDKCLAVRRGEGDSIVKTGKLQPADPQTLARGYVSTDGVGQIANILALKLASDASDESEVRSAIASVVPQLLRNTVTDVSWAATKGEQGYEDKWQIKMPADVANVFNETMAPDGDVPKELVGHFSDTWSLTRYNLKNPQLAWRSVLSVLQRQGDPLTSKILIEVSGALFEPYGIGDTEAFLGSVDANIITGMGGVDEDPFVVVTMRDMPGVKKSLVPQLKPTVSEHQWTDDENGLRAYFSDTGRAMIGSVRGLGLLTMHGAEPPPPTDLLNKLVHSKSPITTGGHDNSSAGQVAEILSEKTLGDLEATSTYFTETRFTKTGIERETTSDLGFIGWIIAQLNEQ